MGSLRQAGFGGRLRPMSMVPYVAAILFIFLLFAPLPQQIDDHRHDVIGHLKNAASKLGGHEETKTIELSDVKSKYAFATFLAGPHHNVSMEDDTYFIASRILAYQLLHAPETRSIDRSIPFIVMVTDFVSEEKRERLRKDGAVVVPAEFIRNEWGHTDTSTWQDVLTKLRLWELTQFDRICFLDADTVLNDHLDGVFQDPAVALRVPGSNPEQAKADEGLYPQDFAFAGVPEMMEKHHYPPTDEGHDFPNSGYLNAGFFVFKPSLEMLDHYLSVIAIPKRFNPQFPEQNLLNYVHRKDGNMPWATLDNTWNIHYPKPPDLFGGVKSMHEKWWAAPMEFRKYFTAWRWKMQGFYDGQDKLPAKENSVETISHFAEVMGVPKPEPEPEPTTTSTVAPTTTTKAAATTTAAKAEAKSKQPVKADGKHAASDDDDDDTPKSDSPPVTDAEAEEELHALIETAKEQHKGTGSSGGSNHMSDSTAELMDLASADQV